MDNLYFLLLMAVPQIHLYVICTVGIVLALRRWQRHPRVSLVILIALSLELARSVGGPLAQYWFRVEMQMVDRAAAEHVIVKFTILNRVLWALDILAWMLILVALFRWRPLSNRLLGHDGQHLPKDFLASGA
jgi:hypothetical protein